MFVKYPQIPSPLYCRVLCLCADLIEFSASSAARGVYVRIPRSAFYTAASGYRAALTPPRHVERLRELDGDRSFFRNPVFRNNERNKISL